ncbi:MAG: hypothetical protein U1F36_17920 [Planctomycetota bacterium]
MIWSLSDPFASLPRSEFAPAGRRSLRVHGVDTELLWLPERRHRRGRPIEQRPALAPDFGARIVETETVWSDGEVALTPNRHPFAARQVIVWRRDFVREPDAALLTAGTVLTGAGHGTLLVNTIGAAASIVRSHAHLVGERLGFLDALRFEPVTPTAFEVRAEVSIEQAAEPFPILLLRIRGPREARVDTALALARHRTSPAFNLIDDGTSTWFCPRPIEVPAPFFPQALGSAELWGRWCWDDEDAFRSATAGDLEAALAMAGAPRSARI